MLNSCHISTTDITMMVDNQVTSSQGSLSGNFSDATLPLVVGELSPVQSASQVPNEDSLEQCFVKNPPNLSSPPASIAPTMLFQSPLIFDKVPPRSHSIPRYYSAADIWGYKAQKPFSMPIKKPATRQPVKTASVSNPTMPAETLVTQPVSPAESLPSQSAETLDNQPANTLSSPPEPRRASYSEIVQLNLPTSPLFPTNGFANCPKSQYSSHSAVCSALEPMDR